MMQSLLQCCVCCDLTRIEIFKTDVPFFLSVSYLAVSQQAFERHTGNLTNKAGVSKQRICAMSMQILNNMDLVDGRL